MNHLIKIEGGAAKLYQTNGAYIRTIANGAVGAVIYGDDIHVTMKDGSVKLYRTNGTYVRTI